MNANCIICSDLFDETKPIAATPCGHVYHDSCLRAWVGQSRTCPQCRSRTFLKGILRLYFNFHPKSDSNSSELENEIVHLTSELSAKNAELAASKQERDRLVVDSEKHILDQLQAVSRQQYENFELTESCSALEARNLELEQINSTLSSDLQHLSNIQKIVNGTLRDAEDILEEYDDHSNGVKQLATYCACLKRELLDSVQSKKALADLTTKLKSENSLYATETRFYVDAFEMPQGNFQETANFVPTLKQRENPFYDRPSTSRKGSVSDTICLSPVSVAFNKNNFNMGIGASTGVCLDTAISQANLKFENPPPVVKLKPQSFQIKVDAHGKFTSSAMIKITKKK